MATAINNVRVQVGVSYDVSAPPAGFDATEGSGNALKSVSFSDGVNAAQVNSLYAAIVNVPANSSVTVNVGNGSLNDPCAAVITQVRVKSMTAQLLTTTDDSTNGTNCTSVTVAGLNGNVAQGGLLDGTNPKLRLWPGWAYPLGKPDAAGVTANLLLTLANEDLTNAAAVLLTVGGCRS